MAVSEDRAATLACVSTPVGFGADMSQDGERRALSALPRSVCAVLGRGFRGDPGAELFENTQTIKSDVHIGDHAVADAKD